MPLGAAVSYFPCLRWKEQDSNPEPGVSGRMGLRSSVSHISAPALVQRRGNDSLNHPARSPPGEIFGDLIERVRFARTRRWRKRDRTLGPSPKGVTVSGAEALADAVLVFGDEVPTRTYLDMDGKFIGRRSAKGRGSGHDRAWQSMTGYQREVSLPFDLPAVSRAKQKDIVEKYVV